MHYQIEDKYRPYQDMDKKAHICVPIHLGKNSTEILSSRPASYQFTKEEIDLLKKHFPKEKWVMKYAIITNEKMIERQGGKRIMLLMDSMPYSLKTKGFESWIEVVAKRPLVESEYEFAVGNLGTQNRRYVTWEFDHIEQLVSDDLKCVPKPAVTPPEFIKKCQDMKLSRSYQTNLFNQTELPSSFFNF